MWVGFHDDPVLRFDGGRTEAMDRARGNGAAVLRTLVEWHEGRADAPATADRPVRPRVQVRRRRRVRPQRAAARHRGADHALGHAVAGRTAARSRRRCRRRIGDFQDFARAVASRYSGRFAGYPFVRFYTIWNESNLATFLVPQFDAPGRIVSPRELREARQGGHRRDQGRQQPGARRDRRDVLERS